MRLSLSCLACAMWLGGFVPALAMPHGGEPVGRAAGGDALGAPTNLPPLTLERPTGSVSALLASEPSAPLPDAPGHDALAHLRVSARTRAAHEAATAARAASPRGSDGRLRVRSRGPPRRL